MKKKYIQNILSNIHNKIFRLNNLLYNNQYCFNIN